MINFLRKNLIFFIVFITGAAVLIIEVAAIRILAPYFGNTIFSVSSILGIILGALSLGYYIGGLWADKNPSFAFFFFLIFAAGVFSILIQALSKIALPVLGYGLGLKTGPPIASLALFFAPSLFLGMMSPFAIKLQSLKDDRIGKVSGSVFFWSTLGSITGSFTAGFFLIPYWGIEKIILSVGFSLAAIGVLGIYSFKGDNYINFIKKPKTLFFFIFVLIFTLISLFFPKPENIIFQKDGLYSEIVVLDTEFENKKTRVLYLDRVPHGAIFLESEELPFPCLKHYSLYEIINPQIKQALFIGGGAYSAPSKILSDENSIERVDVVEIEPILYQLAKQYFRLQEDPRLFNHINDGRRFLKEENRNYDMIFADAYSSLYTIPVHLTTQEFFSLVKNSLSENGFFLINVIGNLKDGSNSFLLSEIKTFKSVFENSYFFAVESLDFNGRQNFIFLGLKNNDRKINLNDEKIINNEKEIIKNLPEKIVNIDNLNLDSALILSDNFAPVEYLIAESF